jgi:hypothetical protein
MNMEVHCSSSICLFNIWISIPLDICPAVGLQDDMITPFLINFGGIGVWTKGLVLLGKCYTTWATALALFILVIFQVRSYIFCLELASCWERLSSKKRRWGSRGQGRMIPASPQDPRVNMGRTAAAHCFPGCKSAELGVEPTYLSWVSSSSVRMKEGQKG